jgi:hypothetical protein
MNARSIVRELVQDVVQLVQEAYIPRGLRQKLTADARYKREYAAVKKNKDWRPAKWEWHTKQTDKAVHFPTHGWVLGAVAKLVEICLAQSLGNMTIPDQAARSIG